MTDPGDTTTDPADSGGAGAADAAELDRRARAVADAIRAGDRLALARTITDIENEPAGLQPRGTGLGARVLDRLFPHVGRAVRLGVTGPPGAGKSTLVSELIARRRAEGDTVGVVAIDPTSPFTGGALLGDRVRMQRHAVDVGAFVRSMASRGALGGLAPRALEVADLLDAAGFDLVITETVGVGQSEIEVAGVADTVLVVLHPESGDGIQSLKAGMLEIADVLVVNKADRPGAAVLVSALEASVALSPAAARAHDHDVARGRHTEPSAADSHHMAAETEAPVSEPAGRRRSQDAGETPALSGGSFDANRPWVPPVLACSARDGTGIDAIWQAVERHREALAASGDQEARREQRVRRQLWLALREAWTHQVQTDPATKSALDQATRDVLAGTTTPRQATRELLARLASSPR